jgi:hypothetical protein
VCADSNWKLSYLSSGMKMSQNVVTAIHQTRVDQAKPSILSNDRQSQVHLRKSSSKKNHDATVGPKSSHYKPTERSNNIKFSFLAKFDCTVIRIPTHYARELGKCSTDRGTLPILLFLIIDRLFKDVFSDCQFLNF